MRKAYWNGKIAAVEDVLIPFEDRGFLYGEGIFTTIRIKDGDPQFLDQHLSRFTEQVNQIDLPPPQIDRRAIADLIVLNQALKGNFRLKLIRTPNQEIAHIDPYIFLEGAPCKLLKEQGTGYQTSATLKSLSYLDRKLARDRALSKGYDDSVLTCPLGLWLEAGCGNLFWREKGEFFYPSQTHLYLKGIILSHLIEILQMEPSNENPSPSAFLYYSNSLQGVRPIIEVADFNYSRNFDLEKEWSFLVN